LTLAEAIATTRVHSVMGLMDGRALVTTRPFRSPHHTISDAGLIGGGTIPKPGEVSLAHHGVLFLNNLITFSSRCWSMTDHAFPRKSKRLRQCAPQNVPRRSAQRGLNA